MAQIAKVLTDLSKYKDSEAIVQYKNVGNGLRGNSKFPNPDIATVDYDADGVDFEKKLASKPKTPVKTELKKVARRKLNRNYKIQGAYVNRVSNGDTVTLTASNFENGKVITPHSNQNLIVKNGKKPGDINIKCKAHKKACSYLIEVRIVSETTPNEWRFCKVLGKHNGKKSGFISGLLYEFRMKIIFSYTEGAFFDTVILRIL